MRGETNDGKGRSYAGSFLLHQVGCLMNGLANTQICATAAEIAVHSFVDLLIAWAWRFLEQGSSGHDLPGLAVTALGNIDGFPGDLKGMRSSGRKAFNGGDLCVGRSGDGEGARPHGLAVDVDGTG